MLKTKTNNKLFDISLNVLDGEHKYKMNVMINNISNHKSFSYSVQGVDNTYIESCELISF